MGLRRGLPEEAFCGTNLSPQEEAAADLGVALGPTPCKMEKSVHDKLTSAFNASDVEWVMLGACMMGWLNRFMHMVGIDLEEALVDECQGMLQKHGWNTGDHAICPPLDVLQEPTANPPRCDTLSGVLSILAVLPSAVLYDMRSLFGVPSAWPASGQYLKELVGFDFPVLGRLQHLSARKAIVSSLKEMLVADSLKISRSVKYLIGVAFSAICENSELEKDMRKLLEHEAGADKDAAKAAADAIFRIAVESGLGVTCDSSWVSWCSAALETDCSMNEKDAAAVIVALASSTAPPRMTQPVVQVARDVMEPGAIIEVAGWMSMLTLLNRMMCYFEVVG
jgi:hypothetical protein